MTDYPTVPELVAEGLSKNAGIACSTKRQGQWIETHSADFKALTQDFARGLYALGIRKGDRVALHAESSTEWLIIDQAILSLGAVSVPIYTTQPGDQIKYIIDNAGARIYIVSTETLFAGCPPDIRSIESLEHVVGVFGSFADLTYEEVLEKGRSLKNFEQPDVSSSDLATIIYTSGTTGVPKGVMLTHANIGSNLVAIVPRLPFKPPARVLSYLPLSHSFERVASLAYLTQACPIYFIEDVTEIKEDIQTVCPTHITTVPRLLEKIHAGLNQLAITTPGAKGAILRWGIRLAESYDLIKGKGPFGHGLAERLVYTKIRANFGGNLRAFTSGGAALAPAIQSFFNGIGIVCGQGYGLTETSPAITFFKEREIKPGSVGTPIRDVEVRIADDGEILVRGPNIMQGYYKMPEQTAETIGSDGWLHTGDIGRQDEDGHLYITDRKKLLFKLSTGKYIAPTPIEMGLCNSPLIEQAVIVGPGRKFCGALIAIDAVTIRYELGEEIDDLANDARVAALIQEVVDTVNRDRPHWEQIKKFVLIATPFTIETGELTPTMKVKRRTVQEKYHDQIESIYA